MKKYHYKLREGYEQFYPHLKLSLKVLALDFDQADESLIFAYGIKAMYCYSIFTITKL